jgi:uncharacterized protein YjbJ (UPF0337 family)
VWVPNRSEQQVRGQAKEWRGKLTDDDLEKIDGKRDNLIGFRGRG